MKVEWIILADHAETINNKLYLMGGGWETLTVNTAFPLRHPCGIAVAFSVPWNETNQVHDIAVDIVDEDEAHELASISGQLEVGRPAGIRLGQSQRVQFALNLMLELNQPGVYAVKAKIEGQELDRAVFRVVPGPNLLRQLPSQDGG